VVADALNVPADAKQTYGRARLDLAEPAAEYRHCAGMDVDMSSVGVVVVTDDHPGEFDILVLDRLYGALERGRNEV
jgi:hypothetical protein